MAGNVGTQSLAVTIRVLMDETVTRLQKLQLILKETRVGFLNGLILGSLSFLFIGLYLMLLKGQTPLFSFAVSFCTGVALLTAMFLSSLSGTIIPLLFKKCHIDPAVASGPLITTVNDLFAVVTYYGMAWLLLIGVLGTIIPLLFKKCHIDPAVASGPLITTVNDLFAVVTYYGMAWLLLIGVLGLA